jgi:hypothetical protein
MRIGLLIAAVCTAGALTACSGTNSPGVPTLGDAGGSAPPSSATCLKADASAPAGNGKNDGPAHTCAGATGDARKNALHAAAECIRRHGVSTYKDPVLTADGHVFTDSRSLQDAEQNTVLAAATACRDLILQADLVPDGQAPAPPKLVAAGVKAAQCMRANGLPNYRDPTANDTFTPGHGFGMHPEDLPGDKSDPTVQHALEACRPVLDAAAQASSMGSLAQ